MLWLCLLLLTGIAAFLRFWRLDYQAYWTDEAYTYERIRDSFTYMLDRLSDQGFPPGWYAMLRQWRLMLTPYTGAADAFQPGCLRLLPAIFGTLTVPAMYFLGRQFTDRRGALLVMLLAAVNPFFIYYARDLKMYAGFWFFVVINMALFFHWLSHGRHWLWFPLFLITGVCMTAMHSMALAIPALQLIFLLTRPKPKGWEVPLWMVALGAMVWIPTYWFFEYTQPAKWSGRLSNDVDKGMFWIQQYTDMSWQTIASLPTSHIFGYLWPVNPPDARLQNWFLLGGDDFIQHLATRSWPWMARWELYAAYGLFVILLLGLLPWRKFIGKKRPPVTVADSSTRGRWWWIFLWIALPTTVLALTWIPPESPWFDRVWHGINPKPFWEPRYLGIVTPAFLLWLAGSLRRLPTVVLRIVAITAVTGVCTLSALSNHLIYRNAPFNRSAAVLEQYISKTDRLSTAVAVPAVKYPFPAENAGTTMARHVVPGSPEDLSYVPVTQGGGNRGGRGSTIFPGGMETENAVRNWLTSTAVNPNIKTIVLTDRYGDLTDEKTPLSNQSLAAMLGPRWKLVHEESYAWHYEWRYYIFHIWRTRVWVLAPVEAEK